MSRQTKKQVIILLLSSLLTSNAQTTETANATTILEDALAVQRTQQGTASDRAFFEKAGKVQMPAFKASDLANLLVSASLSIEKDQLFPDLIIHINHRDKTAFKIKNPANDEMSISFTKPSGYPIDIPRRIPAGWGNPPVAFGPVLMKLRRIAINGKEIHSDLKTIELPGQSNIDLVITFEKPVVDKVLAAIATERKATKPAQVRFHLRLRDATDQKNYRNMMSGKLDFPVSAVK